MTDELAEQGVSKTDYPPPPRWKAARTLGLIYQLNARAFELSAQALKLRVDHELPTLLTRHRDLWLALDDDARRLAARIPYVVLTVHFDDGPWWRSAHAALDHTTPPLHRLPAAVAEDLTHETLMFAWHAVQSDLEMACSTVGLPREVAIVLAKLSMRDVRHVASRFRDDIDLRWPHLPDLWERLLCAAIARDEGQLADVHRHFKLLLSSELRSSLKSV